MRKKLTLEEWKAVGKNLKEFRSQQLLGNLFQTLTKNFPKTTWQDDFDKMDKTFYKILHMLEKRYYKDYNIDDYELYWDDDWREEK